LLLGNAFVSLLNADLEDVLLHSRCSSAGCLPVIAALLGALQLAASVRAWCWMTT
jgi:hypothetical protein